MDVWWGLSWVVCFAAPALTVICLTCLLPILKCEAGKVGDNINAAIGIGVICGGERKPRRVLCSSISFFIYDF